MFDRVTMSDLEVEHGRSAVKGVGVEVKRWVNNKIARLASPQAVDAGFQVTTLEHQCEIRIRVAVRSCIATRAVPGNDGIMRFHPDFDADGAQRVYGLYFIDAVHLTNTIKLPGER
jgi:hypothetical protein